jgi:hypothetical protein
MCDGKQGFGTKGQAAAFIEGKPALTGTHAYECPYCYMWHIGHPAKGRKPRLKKRHLNPLENPYFNPKNYGIEDQEG